MSEKRRTMPSVEQQKRYVADNAMVLNKPTRVEILNIIMTQLGVSHVVERAGEVDIDLDKIEDNDVISQIYNIVRARVSALMTPLDPGRL